MGPAVVVGDVLSVGYAVLESAKVAVESAGFGELGKGFVVVLEYRLRRLVFFVFECRKSVERGVLCIEAGKLVARGDLFSSALLGAP